MEFQHKPCPMKSGFFIEIRTFFFCFFLRGQKKSTTFAIGNKHKSIIWEIESKLYLRKTLRGKNESSLSLLSLTLFILYNHC